MESRDLFGGNMKILLPQKHTDVSVIRDIPDNQEVFTHETTDQCIIIEILQFVAEPDQEAIRTHFEELASSNNAVGPENSQIVSIETIDKDLLSLKECASAYCILAEQFVAKFNEQAKNAINIWMGLFRLPQKETDILVSFNDPQQISPQSSSYTAQNQQLANSMPWTPEQFRQSLCSLTLDNPDFLV